MESLAKILFDFDKLPSKLVLIVCFLSGIILFVPAEFLGKVKLDNFNGSYGQWVGLAFLGSIAFLGVTLVTFFTTKRSKRIKASEEKNQKKAFYKKIEADIKKNLERLDSIEQSALREFFLVGSTVNLPMDNPTVIGLQDKHLIRLAQSNLGGTYLVTGNFEMPFMLTDFARSVVELQPELIGLPMPVNNELTNPQIQQLSQSRPPWVRRSFGY